MILKDKKLKRQQYLSAVLHKFTTTEPVLSLDDIAEVLAMEIDDLSEFLKFYKRQLKK